MVSICERRNSSRIAVLQPLVDDDVAVDHLGDAGLAGVEQLDRLVHGVAGLGLGHHREQVVAALPELR